MLITKLSVKDTIQKFKDMMESYREIQMFKLKWIVPSYHNLKHPTHLFNLAYVFDPSTLPIYVNHTGILNGGAAPSWN